MIRVSTWASKTGFKLAEQPAYTTVAVAVGRTVLVTVADGPSLEAGRAVSVGLGVAVGLELGSCVAVDSMDATDIFPTKGMGDRPVVHPENRKMMVNNR